MGNFALQVVLPLLIVSGTGRVSAFLAPLSRAPSTGRASRSRSTSAAPIKVHILSTSAWSRQRKHHARPAGGLSSNVNLVVVPGSSNHRRLDGRSRRIRGNTAAAAAASTLTIMAGASASGEHGDRRGASEIEGVVPEYGLPTEPGIELVRLDMTEVPVDRAQSFVRNWAKRRLGPGADPGWQGTVRLAQAQPKYGVPPTDMPVSYSRSNLGATLSFDGSPTDVINIEVYHLRRGGSCIMVTRGVDGLAKLGGMGPQIAALVRHSEDVIKEKLQDDLASFADDYHQRVLKGLAPVAESYEEEEEEGGAVGGHRGEKDRGVIGGVEEPQQQQQATILPDGVIDVTPMKQKPAAKKKKKPVAPWMDGSAPPPMERMEDAPRTVELPSRAPAEKQQVPELPEVETLFDEVDKSKLEAEAFELFKTMEKGEKGEEEVAGAESKAGAESFFAEMRGSNGTSEAELMTLFEAGKNASRRGGVDEATIPLSTDLHQLEIMLGGDTGLRGGIDIFAGPPQPIGGRVGGSVASPSSPGEGAERTRMDSEGGETEGEAQRGTYTMYDEYGDPVLELTAEEMDSLDEDELVEAMASIDVLIAELVRSPKDVWNSITASYEDLYLNRCYILAMRARIPKSSRKERDAMLATNQAAVNTVQQLAKMHQKLEMQQLEKIRDICEAALEDMDSLPDKIRYMKPLLDDKFVAYMGYAIQTEREAIEKRGLNPDREPSRWLQVLGVIQKGVMAELQKSVHQDVELISHVLRLTEPEERFALLNITISTLPSMYIRGFKRTATNIVDYYEAMGDDCMDQNLRSMVLEIGENLKVLMSEERMTVLTQEIDEWAAQKAKEDSMESKLRRLREYEAEDLELQRATASGLWNKKMHPDATMDTEEKAEIKKLTDALKGQNLLRSAKIQNALAAKGLGPGGTENLGGGDHGDDDFDGFNPAQYSSDDFDDFDDDGGDDGSYSDDDDLRRKLNRLAGPGGAMEAESRDAPHLFAPGGPLESPGMARAVGGSAASAAGGGGGGGFSGGGVFDGAQGAGAAAADLEDLAELEKEVAADVEELSDVFSDVGAYSSDSMPRPPSVLEREAEEEQEESTGEEWGSFDEGDWRGNPTAGASIGGKAQRDEEDEEEPFLIRPQGSSGVGEEVPGLLGGARFNNVASKAKAAEVEAVEGEEMGGEVRDETARSAGR